VSASKRKAKKLTGGVKEVCLQVREGRLHSIEATWWLGECVCSTGSVCFNRAVLLGRRRIRGYVAEL
jgi:hypothetical protein